ncbi:protein pxr1-like [Willisornis vidua]|uniref:Protein pxr1-like n=1 Tax=Willisornis vidua TaxID=1566151 RepID=A0ABQ9D1A7_9PASS|nr:protein pxr1-like [Willisornis vidua]
MPAESKMDLPLEKAEPMSGGISTSGITDTREEKLLQRSKLKLEKRGVRLWESKNSADTIVSEGLGGSAPGARPEVPLQSLMRTKVR